MNSKRELQLSLNAFQGKSESLEREIETMHLIN
jgi:hypothetical protein